MKSSDRTLLSTVNKSLRFKDEVMMNLGSSTKVMIESKKFKEDSFFTDQGVL